MPIIAFSYVVVKWGSADQAIQEAQLLFVFFHFREDNALFLIVHVSVELLYGRSIDEGKCIVDISLPDSWDDGSRLEHCVFKPFHEDVG